MQRIILAQILKFVGNFVVFSFLSGSHIGSCFCWLYKRILKSKCRGEGRGRGGGGRHGLGPRNDVLTTGKAVTLRGGQRIIVVFFL